MARRLVKYWRRNSIRPVLVQDRPLQPFHEAVGPGMAGQGARVRDPQGAAGVGEGALELRAAVGEDPLQRPVGPLVEGDQDLAQERRGGFGRERGQQPRRPIGAGRIARGDLPDFADSLELADVEGVEADQVAGLRGVHVPGPGAAGARELPTGSAR